MAWPLLHLRQNSQHAVADIPDLKVKAQEIASYVLHGEHGQKRRGGHEKFWQFRDYHEGDRPQDIDWRQSAKGDTLYVREKERHTPHSFYFWSNAAAAGMDFKSEHAIHSKREAAQILSYALALLFQRSDERIGTLDPSTNSGSTKAGKGEEALHDIGMHLFENTHGLPLSGHAPSKAGFVLCSDFLGPLESLEMTLQALAPKDTTHHADGILLQILDPAEITLPYRGAVIFEEPSGDAHTIDHVSSVRDAYCARIQDHIHAIEDLCHVYGWNYYRHVTDQTLADTLLKIWEREQARYDTLIGGTL